MNDYISSERRGKRARCRPHRRKRLSATTRNLPITARTTSHMRPQSGAPFKTCSLLLPNPRTGYSSPNSRSPMANVPMARCGIASICRVAIGKPKTHATISDNEIRKKITIGYPISNTIFEDSRRAVLYQGNKVVGKFDLTQPKELAEILERFVHYAEPDIENFEHAVDEFKESIPDLAQGLLKIIKEEHARNKAFVAAFATFLEQCRTSLDPNMSSATVDEMLVQHLLTERLFRTIFNNQDFTNRNVIASEIEKVIQALTSRAFNRAEFLKTLDRFYVAIENAAKGLEDWTEKQHFLNTVYERFFQGFSVKQADTHGIVYTPQEIVDFMVASVDEVLQREFRLVALTARRADTRPLRRHRQLHRQPDPAHLGSSLRQNTPTTSSATKSCCCPTTSPP